MPVAEEERSTRGRADILARAWTSARLVSTRLERRSCLRWGVQHFSAIGAPARLTTASAPTAAPPSSPVAGFQFTSKPWEVLGEVPGRTKRQTVWPARWRSCVTAVPTKPVEPVIRIFMGSFWWIDYRAFDGPGDVVRVPRTEEKISTQRPQRTTESM